MRPDLLVETSTTFWDDQNLDRSWQTSCHLWLNFMAFVLFAIRGLLNVPYCQHYEFKILKIVLVVKSEGLFILNKCNGEPEYLIGMKWWLSDHHVRVTRHLTLIYRGRSWVVLVSWYYVGVEWRAEKVVLKWSTSQRAGCTFCPLVLYQKYDTINQNNILFYKGLDVFGKSFE